MKLTVFSNRKNNFRSPILKISENIIFEIFKIFNLYHKNSIGGHYAVTRSLLVGLKKNKISFNYNPIFNFQINNLVLVLDGVDNLRNAIKLKKSNKIQKIHVGPNVITRAIDSNCIITNPFIDSIIVPSKWVELFYKDDLPELSKMNFIIWAAGVKLENKRKNKKIISCLIYYKSGELDLAYKIKDFLHNQNLVVYFVKYGKYNKNDYINLLQKSTFSIFISESESQGIAMFESWACDVPSFVWSNPKKVNILNKVISYHSTSPYLNRENGVFFNDFDDFVTVYYDNINNLNDFKARSFIQKMYTDEQSVKYLLKKINLL